METEEAKIGDLVEVEGGGYEWTIPSKKFDKVYRRVMCQVLGRGGGRKKKTEEQREADRLEREAEREQDEEFDLSRVESREVEGAVELDARAVVLEWLGDKRGRRLKDLTAATGIPRGTLVAAKRRIDTERYNPKVWLESKQQEIFQALFESAVKERKTKSQELVLRAMGLLEGSNGGTVINIKLSADEYRKQRQAAVAELGEAGYRVGEVRSEPALLLDKLCVDTEPEHRQEG